MFSFHKPKVYRSSTGCCICKAKSSSSRFTDSKKYEDDFIKCFQLEERRAGEICNACVLLVKRWKKLPVGSSRNWRHVVDARAGPGIKSLTKFKAKNKKKLNKEVPEKFEKILKKKHVYLKNDGEREQSPAMSDDLTEEDVAGPGSKGSSRANSPAGSDETSVGEKRLDIDQAELDISGFIDLTYFKRKNVCCGVIFVGMMGEVMIEPSLFKPCMGCLARQQRERAAAASLSLVAGSSPAHSTSSASASPCHSSASTSPAHSVESSTDGSVKSIGKGFCDSSSDSGYDDSNQGTTLSENKKTHHQQPPLSSQSLHLLAKPDNKPAKKVQISNFEKVTVATAPARLKSGEMKMPIKLLCKPAPLVSSTKHSLSNSTSRPVETVLTTVSTVHDFAVRPPPHRQSLAN